jgi:hypothetical protein
MPSWTASKPGQPKSRLSVRRGGGGAARGQCQISLPDANNGGMFAAHRRNIAATINTLLSATDYATTARIVGASQSPVQDSACRPLSKEEMWVR